MQSLSEISLTEFKEALTPQAVRTFKIIHRGIAAGAMFFFFVICIIYLTHKNIEPDNINMSLYNILSVINVLIAVSVFISSKVVYDSRFSSKNLQDALSREFTDNDGNPVLLTPAQKCFSVIRTASIIRLAMLEGSAFFGLVTTMLIVQNGVAFLKPIYCANALAIVPLLIVTVKTCPTAERIENTFQERIKNLN